VVAGTVLVQLTSVSTRFVAQWSHLPSNLVANLRLAGRVVGSDRQAYGSIRVMGTAFATGHAAGISAALACEGGAETDIRRLRKLLLEQGAIL